MPEVQIIDLISGAFRLACQRHQTLHEKWVRISFRLGLRLPRSVLSGSLQRDGNVDLLLRCMEDELLADPEDAMLRYHHLAKISEMWILCVYESFRLLRARKLVDEVESFDGLVRDLELVRIPPQGFRLNEHPEHDCGLTVFQHACKMGLEGIVLETAGVALPVGRSPDWLKLKNPEAPAR
jgi:hypothetical protein